jgi:hypothetical protein
VHDGGARGDGPVLQGPLDVVLRGDQQVREPGRQRRKVQSDPVEQSQVPDGCPGGDHGVGETAGVEQLEGSGVYAEGTGETRATGTAFEHGDVDAGRGEVPGEQQSGRAGTDDRDGCPGFDVRHGYSPTVFCQRLLATP